MKLREILTEYLHNRPLFLSLIRAKEAELYQRYLPLKKPVLDIGVGDGYFANVIRQLADHPERTESNSGAEGSPIKSREILRQAQDDQIDVGLDLEDSRIEEAGKLGIYKKLIIYNGKELPFPDNTFPTVISNCVLEHIPSLELTLREIRRVLRPGGLFLTTVVSKPWEENFLGNLLLGDLYKIWMRKKQVHINMNSVIEWRKVFGENGFRIKDEIGYLDKTAVRFIDLFHYISLPNLITYKLFGKWVIWKGIINIFPIEMLSQMIEKDISSSSSGNIFFALQKKFTTG